MGKGSSSSPETIWDMIPMPLCWGGTEECYGMSAEILATRVYLQRTPPAVPTEIYGRAVSYGNRGAGT